MMIRRGTVGRSGRRGRDGREGRDGGQAAIVVVTTVATLVVVMSLALATMGRTAVDRTRAQTAADAAALASLDGGRAAAIDLAARHGALVAEWSMTETVEGSTVTVTVRLGDTWATARATDMIDVTATASGAPRASPQVAGVG